MTAIFISGSQFSGVARAATWGGADVEIMENTTVNTNETAGSLKVTEGKLTIGNGGSVTTDKNTIIGSDPYPVTVPSIDVTGTGSLTVGHSTEDLTSSVKGAGSLNVSNGGTLRLQNGSGKDDAARLVLNGNVNISGSGRNTNSLVIGNHGILNGTGAAPGGNGLGFYVLPSKTAAGSGNVLLNNTGIAMGDGAAIIGGNGGMTLTGVAVNSDSSTANQVLGTTGDMTVTDSDFAFGSNGQLQSLGKMDLNDADFSGSVSAVLKSGDDMTIRNGSRVTSSGGVAISSDKNISINGSEFGNTATNSNVSSSVQALNGITITGGSTGRMGYAGRITAGNNLSINGSGTNVSFGSDGVMTSTVGNVEIGNSASVSFGDGGTMQASVGGVTINGGSTVDFGDSSKVWSAKDLAISGNNTTVNMGNDSIFGSYEYNTGSNTYVLGKGDVNISGGASLTQGNDSAVRAGVDKDVNITNADVLQGNNALIDGKNVNISSSSTVEQGNDSTIAASAALKIESGSSVEQGINSMLSGNTVDISTSTVTQGDDSSIQSNASLTISGNSVVSLGDDARVVSSNGDVAVSGSALTMEDNGLLSANGSTSIISSQVAMEDNGRIYGGNGVTIGGTGSSITMGDNGTIATAASKDISVNGNVKMGNGGRIATTAGGVLTIERGSRISMGDDGTIINSDAVGSFVLDGVRIEQFGYGLIQSVNDIVLSGGTLISQGRDSRLVSQTGNISLDSASVYVGTDGYIKTNDTIDLRNGSILNVGSGTRIVGSTNSETDRTVINVRDNSEINTDGLVTFNNDVIHLMGANSIMATGWVPGTIHLTNGTVLDGIGTVRTSSGLVVTNGAKISPGNAAGEIATMDVYGPLTFTKTGIYVVDTGNDGRSCDLISVKNYTENGMTIAGDVTIGDAKLELHIGSADFANGVFYKFIESEGTIGGMFDTESVVVDNDLGQQLRFLDVVQYHGYEGDKEYLALGVERNTFFEDSGWTHNERAAGSMLDNTDLSNPLWWDTLAFLGDLDTYSPEAYHLALHQLSGDIKANSMNMYRENQWRTSMDQIGWTPNNQVFLGKQNRFAPNICGRNNFWITPYYSDTKVNTDGNGSAYDVNSTGFLAGINRKIDHTTALGVVFGYSRPKLTQFDGSVEMDDFTIGLQGGTMLTSKLELKAFVGAGFQDYSMERTIFYMPGSRFTSNFNGNTMYASIELARPFYFVNGGMLRPLIAFESENVWQDSTREFGSGTYPFADPSLEFANRYNDRTFFRTGFTGEAGTGQVTLTGKVFYSHQLGRDTFAKSDARFIGSPDYKTVRSVDLERNYLTVGAGGNIYLNPMKSSVLSVNYDATFSDKATSQVVYMTWSKNF